MTAASLPPRREPVECAHCGEVTMPNLLADGSLVCSCAAERSLTPASPPLAAPPQRPK